MHEPHDEFPRRLERHAETHRGAQLIQNGGNEGDFILREQLHLDDTCSAGCLLMRVSLDDTHHVVHAAQD
ncbi:hypothetical protein D3C72_2438470 [compost metagenome]